MPDPKNGLNKSIFRKLVISSLQKVAGRSQSFCWEICTLHWPIRLPVRVAGQLASHIASHSRSYFAFYTPLIDMSPIWFIYMVNDKYGLKIELGLNL